MSAAVVQETDVLLAPALRAYNAPKDAEAGAWPLAWELPTQRAFAANSAVSCAQFVTITCNML